MDDVDNFGFGSFPSNNGKKQPDKKQEVEQKPKVKPIVSGKKSALSNFNIVNTNEGPKQIGSNIASKILVPSIKKTLKEIGESILNTLFGNGKNDKSSSFSSSLGLPSFTPYAGMFGLSTSTDSSGKNINNASFGSLPDWNAITYSSMEDCDAILKMMYADATRYGKVSILDLYDYSGVPCNQTTYAGFGWRPEHFQEASYKETIGGRWKILLPKPISIR